MAYNRIIKSITRPAGADLSLLQYTIVELNATNQVVTSVTEVQPKVGILMNKPSAAGQAAEIAINGSVVKCIALGTTAEGDWLTAGAGGHAEVTTTNLDEVIGFALTAGVDGDLIEVVVVPQTASFT